MENEEVEAGLETELDDEEIWYNDDPVEIPQINWFAKFRSFSPIVTLLIVTTFFLPNTVGGRINISSGISNIEFGKGLIQAPTCAEGQQLSLSLSAKFDNSSNKFLLSSISIGGLPSNCQNKDILISLYSNSTGSIPMPFFNGTNSRMYVFMNIGPIFERGYLGTGMSITNLSSDAFTANVNTPFADATKVDKVTIESSEHRVWPCNLGGSCLVGDTGPGTGTIFYVDMNGFDCGPLLNLTCNYLEYAPTDATNGSVWTPTGFAVTGVETATTVALALAKSKISLGAANTKNITDTAGNCPTPGSQQQCSAAYKASKYVVSGNSLTDWFLPNLAELNELCKFVNNILGTAPTVACAPTNTTYPLAIAKGFGSASNPFNYAWLSSTAYSDSKKPYAIHFLDTNALTTFFTGNPMNYGTGGQFVRAIRAF